MSASGDGEPTPTRKQQIWARVGQIRAELDALLREAQGIGDDEDTPEKRRAAFRLLKGGLILVLIGASLGMAHAAGWVGRHARTVAAAAVTVGAAGVIAGALLAHGSAPPPRHGATGPIPAPSATATLSPSAAPRASASAGEPSSAPHGPGRTVPAPMVAVPSRSRRTGAAASGAPHSPAGASPTPSRPAPTPTGSPPGPPPPPWMCPIGMLLKVIGIGVYVCV